MGVNINDALALVRRYATAIAQGKVEASKLAAMTDDELIAFDQAAFDGLVEAQKEAQAKADEL